MPIYANMFARVHRIYLSFQLQEQKYLLRKWYILFIMFIVEEQETTAEWVLEELGSFHDLWHHVSHTSEYVWHKYINT